MVSDIVGALDWGPYGCQLAHYDLGALGSENLQQCPTSVGDCDGPLTSGIHPCEISTQHSDGGRGAGAQQFHSFDFVRRPSWHESPSTPSTALPSPLSLSYRDTQDCTHTTHHSTPTDQIGLRQKGNPRYQGEASRQTSSPSNMCLQYELTESGPPGTLALGSYRGKSLPCVNKPANWKLTRDDFNWLASVLAPKRRPNKREPTPSGTCRFCDVVCARAGSLQQHVVFQHRQRIARKCMANDFFNQDLALAFTVLQLDADNEYEDMSYTDVNLGGRRTIQEATECDLFRANLAEGPVTSLSSYPHLEARFRKYCTVEKWRGVHCSACGMLVQRKLNLDEHRSKCPAILGSYSVKSKGAGRGARPDDA